MINKYNLSIDPVFTKHGSKRMLLNNFRFRCSNFIKCHAFRNGKYGLPDGSNDIERIANDRFVERNSDDYFRFCFKYHGEQTIVWANNILMIVKCDQDLFGFYFEKIYQDNMKCELREISDGVATNICSLGIVEGGEVMADVDDLKGRAELHQLSFDGAREIILLTDV